MFLVLDSVTPNSLSSTVKFKIQIKTKCWSEIGFSEIIKQWKICHWLEQHCLDVVHQWYVWNYWLKMILVLEIWSHYVHLYLSQSMDFSMGSKWGKKSYKFQVGIEIVYCRFSQDYSFKLSYVAAKWYVKDQRPAFFMSLFRNLSAFKGIIHSWYEGYKNSKPISYKMSKFAKFRFKSTLLW